MQTFRAGGSGGQNQNKRDTGVRIIHPPSGAVGESREERTQLANKKNAFRRMGESETFKAWALLHVSGLHHSVEKEVEKQMKDIIIEEGFHAN